MGAGGPGAGHVKAPQHRLSHVAMAGYRGGAAAGLAAGQSESGSQEGGSRERRGARQEESSMQVGTVLIWYLPDLACA